MRKIEYKPIEFSKELPPELDEVILLVMRKGFSLTLIGGAVRDFLRTGKIGNDLDFELKHSMPFSEEEWKSRLKLLKKEIQKQWECEELSFNILRINLGEYDVELSSARREKYNGEGPFNHSDFEVTLDPSLSNAESVQRRDFTLNSIGVYFGAPGTEEEYQLVDPLNGVEDLRNNTLRPSGSEFYKDPVRLLRTIRFHLKYQFSFDQIEFEKFDLTHITLHWILTEAAKSMTTEFFSLFFKILKENNISLNPKLKSLEVFSNLKKRDWAGNREQLIIQFLEENSSNEKNRFQELGETLQLNKQFVSSVWELISLTNRLSEIDQQKLKNLSDIDFAKSDEFHFVKNLHHFSNKYSDCLNLIKEDNISKLIKEVLTIWPLGFEQNLEKPDYSTLPKELRSSYIYKAQLLV